MAMWNPWRGCKKCSDGCLHCYIHKGDFKRNVDTNDIVKTKDFYKPTEKLKNGNYKMKSGIVYLCFSTDFLIEEADAWRLSCWEMIKERQDCTFLFLTKRIDRFLNCIPNDWGDGYDNVVVGCTIENQKTADYKLSIFKDLPIKLKCITAQPLLENIDIEKYLDDIELVIVGWESDLNARWMRARQSVFPMSAFCWNVPEWRFTYGIITRVARSVSGRQRNMWKCWVPRVPCWFAPCANGASLCAARRHRCLVWGFTETLEPLPMSPPRRKISPLPPGCWGKAWISL